MRTFEKFILDRVKRWVIVIGLSFTVSCAAVNQLNLLTPKDEVEIGRQASKEIEKEMPMLKDATVVAYIDSLGQAMVKASELTMFEYHFNVVDTDDVNAFALPGGYLYVNRGLIETADTEAELAGVIGHEIGHVVGHHGARQISKQYGLAVAVEVITGGGENSSLARDIASQFASFGAGLTLLKYGRLAEQESDAYAVQFTSKAGIHPEGAAQFFEKLLALHENQPEGMEVWFTTHPPTQERIDFVRQEIQKLPTTVGLRMTSDRFEEIKARVLAYKKNEPISPKVPTEKRTLK
jgi:predicted Zn-dependent protease